MRTRRARLIGAAWIAIAAAVVGLFAFAYLTRPATSASARIVALEKEIRCPSCGGLPVYSAKTASASSIRAYITHEVDSGASNQEITDSLVASYGDSVLLAPPTNGVGLYLWLLPLAVGVLLAVELARTYTVRRASRGETVVRARRATDSEFDHPAPAAAVLAPSRPRSAQRARRPRLLQAGVLLLAVGVGALVTLVITGARSERGPSVADQLASAETLAGLGAVRQARAVFEQVLARDPSDATALAYVGWIDFNLAKSAAAKASAINQMAEAAHLGRFDASAQLYYGLALYYGEDQPTQAVARLERFLGDSPNPSLVRNAAPLARPVYQAAHRKIPAQFAG
jgi:cytochrome c-type biogenesis protein CcmH